MTQAPAAINLSQRGIPHQVFQHIGAVTSLEQAARERGQQPEQVVRSIVFRLGEGRLLMVLMAGPGQVPWKALRRLAGQSRLTMASEEEVYAATACRPGTVNPFMRDETVTVWVDQAVMAQAEVSLGSGVRGVAIVIRPTDLLDALDAYRIIDLSAEG